MTTLNIGCGADPEGDVRVDIERFSHFYKRKTTANIIASAEYLPFRDIVFNDIRCSHILEHLDHPELAVREAIRVGGRVCFHYPIDKYTPLIETIECFRLLLDERNIRKFLIHFRKMLRWNERFNPKMGGHKWSVHMDGEKVYYYKWNRLHLKIPSEYRIFRGETWVNKPDYVVEAKVKFRSKTLFEMRIPVKGQQAENFDSLISEWFKHVQEEKRGEQLSYWNKRIEIVGIKDSVYALASTTEAKEVEVEVLTDLIQNKIMKINTLLDLGCGWGRLYPSLSSKCDRYTGVDFLDKMLNIFSATHSLRSEDRLYLHDVTSLPFLKDESMNAVWACVTLQHITDDFEWNRAIQEIKRVLKKEGYFYFIEPLSDNPPFEPVSWAKIRKLSDYYWALQPEIIIKEIQRLHLDFTNLHYFIRAVKKLE